MLRVRRRTRLLTEFAWRMSVYGFKKIPKRSEYVPSAENLHSLGKTTWEQINPSCLEQK